MTHEAKQERMAAQRREWDKQSIYLRLLLGDPRIGNLIPGWPVPVGLIAPRFYPRSRDLALVGTFIASSQSVSMICLGREDGN